MNEYYKNKKDHTFVKKGWGYELWMDNREQYCGKILGIDKDKKFSMHYHRLKTETFYVCCGEIELLYYQNIDIDKLVTDWENIYNIEEINKINLVSGESFHIPIGMRHSVKAFMDSKIIETSTQHFEEDSYRILKGD